MFKKFDFEADIWTGIDAKYEYAPRVILYLDQDTSVGRASRLITELDELSAKGNLTVTTSTVDYFRPIALISTPLRAIAAVLRPQDNLGREIASALIEDRTYQSILSRFGVNQIALEYFPNAERNGVYRPQAPWVKRQLAVA